MDIEKLKQWPTWCKPEDFSIEIPWKVFEHFVIPKDAHRIQREEMEKAFFGGWTECFKVMTDYAGELSEDEALQFLDRMRDENNSWVDKMIRRDKTNGT